VALHRRNIMINSLLCPLCGSSNESLHHLLIDCLVALVVWNKVANWCSLPIIQVNSVQELLDLHHGIHGSEFKKMVVKSIILCGGWVIWKHRNNIIFNYENLNINSILVDLKTLSYLWITNRSKKENISWDDWCKFSLM
jgi:hypothetical protein